MLIINFPGSQSGLQAAQQLLQKGKVHWWSLEDVGWCWGSCSPQEECSAHLLPSEHLSEQGPAPSQVPPTLLSSIYISLSFFPIVSHKKKFPFLSMSKYTIIVHRHTAKGKMCFKHLDKCICVCKWGTLHLLAPICRGKFLTAGAAETSTGKWASGSNSLSCRDLCLQLICVILRFLPFKDTGIVMEARKLEVKLNRIKKRNRRCHGSLYSDWG